MKRILCFGDSNTWGLIPGTDKRFADGVRWTSIIRNDLEQSGYEIIEEGLCGRTTIFEDPDRIGRAGDKLLPVFLESHAPLDMVIIMLGTNDCKTRYGASASVIARGLDQVIRKARLNASQHFDLLVVSPIHLGHGVGEADFDPEFDERSEVVSRNLANEYRKVALQNHAAFLNAADFASPSTMDREHMDEVGHAALADAIYDKITALEKGLANVI